jgi:hypothetical protein
MSNYCDGVVGDDSNPYQFTWTNFLISNSGNGTNRIRAKNGKLTTGNVTFSLTYLKKLISTLSRAHYKCLGLTLVLILMALALKNNVALLKLVIILGAINTMTTQTVFFPQGNNAATHPTLQWNTTIKDELSATQKYPQHNRSTFQLILCDVPMCCKD